MLLTSCAKRQGPKKLVIIVPEVSRAQLALHGIPFGDVPAWVAVGRHTIIRKLNCRTEDHIGFRFPTNHIWVCSQMTASISE